MALGERMDMVSDAFVDSSAVFWLAGCLPFTVFVSVLVFSESMVGGYDHGGMWIDGRIDE